MANFILELDLITEKWQADILNKRFNIGCSIYNSLLNKSQRRYNKMIRDRRYIDLYKSLTKNKEADKPIWNQINDIREEYRLTKTGLEANVKEFQYYYKKHIDSATAQKIADRLWLAYEDFFFGNGKEIHYKKRNTFDTLESKSNASGIRYKDNCVIWNKLILKPSIDSNDKYAEEALTHDISFCRIKRKLIRGKYKYYLQLILKGIPPAIHKLGKGTVGLDIGTSTLAYSSKSDVNIIELADKVERMENELTSIQQSMDKSRRVTNPNNYNNDGTVKEGKKKWICSNKYKKLQAEYKEIKRKQAAIRKQQHEELANYILSLGNKVYVEDMNFKELTKRSDEETEVLPNGLYKSKRRFGKSIGNRAPAMLIQIIERKLSYYNIPIYKIDTYKTKASQFNHKTCTYEKKTLNDRWTKVGRSKIQRDMYSAFLIQHSNDTLDSFNIKECNRDYKKFKKLHDIAIKNLKGHTTLSSIGL